MEKQDIERLAVLARIELTPEEVESFALEVSHILGYVGNIKEITGNAPEEKVVGPVFNVMREDENPHEPGLFTEDLLNAAPERVGEFIQVKKILDQDS